MYNPARARVNGMMLIPRRICDVFWLYILFFSLFILIPTVINLVVCTDRRLISDSYILARVIYNIRSGCSYIDFIIFN